MPKVMKTGLCGRRRGQGEVSNIFCNKDGLTKGKGVESVCFEREGVSCSVTLT